MVKKILLASLITLLSINMYSVIYAQANTVNVKISGKLLEFTDAKPFIDENDRIQIPLCAVSETLGYNVIWTEETQSVFLSKGTNQCSFTINNPNVLVSAEINGGNYGAVITMDTVPVIIDDRTYIPLRYMFEAFNKNVEWDGETSTVFITDSDKDFPDVVTEAYQSALSIPYSPDDAEQITDIYTGENIPSEWDVFFEKASSKTYNAVNLLDMIDGDTFETDEIVDMTNNVYEIKIKFDEDIFTTFSGNVLKNLSNKALVEFIPDEETDSSDVFRIDFRQGRANMDGEYSYFLAKEAQKIPTGKRSIFLVENIENAPYEVNFDCFANTEAFSGTIRIVNFE